MPNTREKLIELLGNMSCDSLGIDGCDVCKYRYEIDCNACAFADHLIANGVRLEEKQATSDETSKWIPVTERLPEENGDYLVFKDNRYGCRVEILGFAKDGRKVDKYDFYRGWKNVWYYYDSEWGHITTGNVTHWMPLPEPPKGE